jgi:thiamine pyrophosphate-dependent acetolactate synthase large subunit-like protein
MYSIQALWTAVQEKLPMVMIVMNNHWYGAMKSFSRLLGDSEPPGRQPTLHRSNSEQFQAERGVIRLLLSSFDPGLAKMLVTPCERTTS